jgi:hypothetical protein
MKRDFNTAAKTWDQNDARTRMSLAIADVDPELHPDVVVSAMTLHHIANTGHPTGVPADLFPNQVDARWRGHSIRHWPTAAKLDKCPSLSQTVTARLQLGVTGSRPLNLGHGNEQQAIIAIDSRSVHESSDKSGTVVSFYGVRESICSRIMQ